MPPEVGDVINNRYRLVRRIGDGGMGSVFEAHHLLLGTDAALKFLHPHLARKKSLAERFLQEAQASARVKNPHIVSALDVDTTDEGEPYMVMELVQGGTLQDIYKRVKEGGGWLERKKAFDCLFQLFEGMEAAHAAGVVHRDLKPDNVMVEEQPSGGWLLKIMDFGVAKLKAVGDEQGLTRPGMVMGTPEFMAPEQAISSHNVDHRADVFSLGVMAFQLLSGSLPTIRGNLLMIARSHMSGDIVELGDVAPELDPAVCETIHKAMAAKAEDRFPSVEAFRRALEACVPAAERRYLTVTKSNFPPPPQPGRDSPIIATLEEAPLPASLAAESSAPPASAPAGDSHQAVSRTDPPPKGGAGRWVLGLVALVLGGAAAVAAVPSTRAKALAIAGLDDSGRAQTRAPRKPKDKPAAPKPATTSVATAAASAPAPAPTPSAAPSAAVASQGPALARQSEGKLGKLSIRFGNAASPKVGGMLPLSLSLTDADGKPVEAQRFTVIASYYHDQHATRFSGKRTALDDHRFEMKLARSGKYHMMGSIVVAGRARPFYCNICVGSHDKLCPKMAKRCASTMAAARRP